MKILALDTASDRLLAGIADGSKILAEFTGEPDRSHSERVIATLDSLLRKADIASTDLDALAVAVGPGSFTGLRVGIATALGLAQAWHKPIRSVGNAGFAFRFFSQRGLNPVVVTHCRGEEFYVSESGASVTIMSSAAIAEKYSNRQFGGFGAGRLSELALKLGVRLEIVDRPIWTGGEFAKMISEKPEDFELLDPADLDVNYVLKSQPEQKRDAVARPISVRDLRKEDLVDVLRVEREAFSDPWEEANFLADIENQHVIAMAACDDLHCVGYLCCIALDDYGYVANIAVDPEYRSRGVGRALMDDLRKRLTERAIHDIVLDVRVSNSRAIGFYEKYGFSVITRRKGFYSTPPEDSFTMLKTLED